LTDPTFSQRTGIKPLKKPFQLGDMNRELKTGLWNAVLRFYLSHSGFLMYKPDKNLLFKKVYADLFSEAIDEMPVEFVEMKDEIKADILERLRWNEIYDLIEFLPNNYINDEGNYNDTNKTFIEYCNKVLARENAGYRFVNKRIAEITSEQEIKEIEAAINLSIDPVRVHIEKALDLMSDREKPDYRNSIKESISAVESLVNNISGKKNATLSLALDVIIKQKKIILAPSLKLGLEKIYGYTSSSDGIRHSLMKRCTI
jgi:hypothetical protein